MSMGSGLGPAGKAHLEYLLGIRRPVEAFTELALKLAGLTNQAVHNDVSTAIQILAADSVITGRKPEVRMSFFAQDGRSFLRFECGADPNAADEGGQPWKPDNFHDLLLTFMRSGDRIWIDIEVPLGEEVRLNSAITITIAFA